MRIWSLHPKYLDAKGIVALWRETLLAKHVLQGKTKGYKHHPQLQRFKKTKTPIHFINQYLFIVYQEAEKRGYRFDKRKTGTTRTKKRLPVTAGQIDFEIKHLLRKLRVRDRKKYEELKNKKAFNIHPAFKRVKGEIEDWEKI